MKTKIYKRHLGIFIIGLFLFLVTSEAYAIPEWSFSAIPASGDIEGPAGSTIGWGYEVYNPDPVNWLSIINISADPFLHGSPDAFIFDFPTVAPGETVSMLYDGFTGLFQFTWDSDAPEGFVNTGNFLLNAEWLDSLGNSIGFSFKEAPYSARVASAAVPEPSTLLLLASGLAGLVFKVRKGR